MDLHRFWDGVITSNSNLTRLRNEATALRNCHDFHRSQLTELMIAYRNGAQIGIPKRGSMDCAKVAAAAVFPAGCIVSASRIADRGMMLAVYRLADLFIWLSWKLAVHK
jgi:hypothetical protein